MTSSSKPPVPPGGAKPASPYTRFIPAEELQGFAAWTPDAIGAGVRPAGAPAAAPPANGPSADEWQQRVQVARQAGYQDGYRDGLAGLEAFKQSHAQQVAAQIGTLVRHFDAEFGALEVQMAEAVARTATALARQVVRAELASDPSLVARIAQEAVGAVLLSARHITVHLHPDDLPLVALGAAEALQTRGARLVASNQVSRGGCTIESDLGAIDARIERRWEQVAAVLGQPLPWSDPPSDDMAEPEPANIPVPLPGSALPVDEDLT